MTLFYRCTGWTVSPKMICVSPNLPYIWLWPYLEIGTWQMWSSSDEVILNYLKAGGLNHHRFIFHNFGRQQSEFYGANIKVSGKLFSSGDSRRESFLPFRISEDETIFPLLKAPPAPFKASCMTSSTSLTLLPSVSVITWPSMSLSLFSLLVQFVHYIPHMSEIVW